MDQQTGTENWQIYAKVKQSITQTETEQTQEIQSTLNRVKNSTMIYRRQQNHAKATAYCNRIGCGRVKGYE